MGGYLMRRRLAFWVAMLALAFSCVGASAANLPRLVSMNVCTDQLVLTLADPEQILGLSRFSRDGWQSKAGDLSRYPVLSGGAEDVLLIQPDIVVASAFDKRSTRELLKAKGLRLAELAVPRTLDEARQQIREAGDITGHPDRAAAEIARLDAALARAHRAVSERHFYVLPLSRRGWVAGSDSFVGSLLAETGLRRMSECPSRVEFGALSVQSQIPFSQFACAIGCWVLDVGCWMLGVGCWMLGVGCWMLDVGCSILTSAFSA